MSTALGKVARPETSCDSGHSAPNRDRGRAGWGRHGASIDESMGEAIKVTVIATGFDSADAEIPVEIAAPARVVASAPSRRDSVRDALREGFSSMPPSRAAHSTGRPSLNPDLVPAMSTRRPAALAASLQAGSSPISSAGPEVRPRIAFPATLDADADWDTPAFQRRNGG